MIRRDNYTFTGIDNLPDPLWDDFFSLSTIGQSYEILWDDSNNGLIMSNTEFEVSRLQPFIDKLNTLPVGADVLALGYGIGLINSYIRNAGANLTVIEIEPNVVSLEENNIDDITIIYDDAFSANYSTLFPTKKFDLILWDVEGGIQPSHTNQFIPTQTLHTLLKDEGEFWRWSMAGCHCVPNC